MTEAPGYLYVPLGFRPSNDGRQLVPTYPAGLPFFIAAFAPVFGWERAGDVVIVLFSIGGVLLTFAFCRTLELGPRSSLIASLIVAGSPLYVFMSLQAMSDVPSLFWTLAAGLFAIKSRNRPSWALAAGAAVAVAVFFRPTNFLVTLALAPALGFSKRRWALFVAGGIPGAVLFAAHSHAAYGSVLTTGYGDVSSSFSSGYVADTLIHYSKWLPVLFTPVAVLALGIPWLPNLAIWKKSLLVVWIVVFCAFYSAYVCTHESCWYLRFLLPAVPPLVAGGMLVLSGLLTRLPAYADFNRSSKSFLITVILLATALGFLNIRLHGLGVGKGELRYGHLANWLKLNLPNNAVCVSMQASGAIFYYTDLPILRWDMLDATKAKRVETAILATHEPLYAVLFPFEIHDLGALSTHMPGRWTVIGTVDNATILRLDSGT